MIVWKDKEGKKVSLKEFLKRWGEGIEGITPLQQTKTSLMGYRIVILGMIWGLIITAFGRVWWMFTILLGSMIITLMSQVGLKQKYKVLKEMNKLLKQSEEEPERKGIEEIQIIENGMA